MVKSTWLYYFGRALFRMLFATVWRWKVQGRENIPVEGGVIIAPNHANFADPPLTGSAMKRPLYFMAKKELFDVPILGYLIRQTHAFPVKRGSQDIGAIRTAQRVLESGKALLVFPEGGRTRDGNFRHARPGLGMLACMAQVPVVPVRLYNTFKLGSLRKLQVHFGKPLMPPKQYSRETYQRFSEEVLEEIKKL